MAAPIAFLAALLASPLLSHALNGTNSTLRYITLEEHMVPEALASYPDSNALLQILINTTFGPELMPELLDANTTRLASMDANNISIQVLNNNLIDFSNATACQESNNLLYTDWIQAHPTRYRGFCCLAMGDPSAAATELERCVNDLGFVGGLTNNDLANSAGTNYTYYDSPEFWPVFAMAESLDVPIYIHPSFAPSAQVLTTGGQYAPGIRPDGSPTFSNAIAANLASTAWQFEAGTGVHFMRLWAAGLFDAYPNLKLVFGHMGELLPYMLERSGSFLDPLSNSSKTLEQVYTSNIWITTSGVAWLDQMPTVLKNTPMDHIMYSVDYPFNNNTQGSQFMQALQASGLVTQQEFEAIAYGNAQTLLKIT